MCNQQWGNGKLLRPWKEKALTCHTRTLMFLSSYDISSHPKMIQLISGFFVSRPNQFIIWLYVNTDSLYLVGTVRWCKIPSSFARVWEKEICRKGRLLFWLSKSGACAHIWACGLSTFACAAWHCTFESSYCNWKTSTRDEGKLEQRGRIFFNQFS